MLRPGYCSPNRKDIGGYLLDDIHEQLTKNMKSELEGKDVELMQDGWSDTNSSLTSTIADACDVWLDLLVHEDLQSYENKVKKRFDQVMTGKHFLANMLHPVYRGEKLSKKHTEIAQEMLLRNLQHSTLTKHNDTKEHKDAVEAHQMRKQLYSVEDTITVSDNEELKVSEADKHLFRTVYFAAKENQPNSSVNKLLELLKASGVQINYQDLTSDTILDIQKSLLFVLDEAMKDELKEAKYYGLILDESTDLSVHKKLVVYIRYVCPSDMKVKSQLVGDIRIPDGTADTLVCEVRKLLQTLGLKTVNLVGLGSDGASVMFGRKGGVGVKLQEDSPMMTHVHCVAHRLALACSDATKAIPYLKNYKNILKNLYTHVNGSGIRTYKLEEMQSVMEEPNLKLKDPINIRWLAMENAVRTVHKCYGSIVTYLQSNEGKNTVGDVIAEGLLREVLHYKFPAFTAILADALQVLGVLSKQLQAESLDLSQFTPMKDSAVGKLNGPKTVNGECMKEFESQISTNGNKVYYKGIQLTHSNEKKQC
ncbi:zinc finger protein 862-like [Mercenaria mercenaria]|uniref:zinc finger protein 862-like n=1 Tax=Mercenaria mercenaria TaxID=6596 RepID=UPI00234E7D99|nr:zinc finger protein 862-like [Mercenaria mercenaria]